MLVEHVLCHLGLHEADADEVVAAVVQLAGSAFWSTGAVLD